MPVISALIVFHRDAPFLRAAIASVLAQTFRDLELVLVDNGANLSVDVLGKAVQDPRVRWVRLGRNEGIPGGHNAGISAASGEFIALLDYDDLALPSRFECQLARLRKEPQLGLVSSLAATIDEEGTVRGREFSLVEPQDQYAYLQFAAPVVTPAYMGRREIFLRFPYRAEFPFAADFDFLARAAEVTKMSGVPEVLLHYRRHRGQTTELRKREIEHQRAAIRGRTADRRAGKSETTAAVQPGGSPADCALRWAHWNIAQRQFPLAAYHARRALALERTLKNTGEVVRLGMTAIRGARGSERRLAGRLFFMGPVRALNLRPC